MKLIDIEDAKQKKKAEKRKAKKALNAPDNNLITISPDGKKYFLFSVRYVYKQKNFTFELWATSKKDAVNRICSIQRFPVEVSQIHSIIQ